MSHYGVLLADFFLVVNVEYVFDHALDVFCAAAYHGM